MCRLFYVFKKEGGINTLKQKIKQIDKEKFLYLKENTVILNMMVHFPDDETTLITNDKSLTFEIFLLRKAVKRFENKTKLNIKVM